MRLTRSLLTSALTPLLVGLQSLVLVACDATQPLTVERSALSAESDARTSSGPSDQVSSVKLSTTDTTLLVGATTQATAVPTKRGGRVNRSARVTWSTSPDSVATVSESGLITAVGPGSVEIFASVQGLTKSLVLTVTAEGSEALPDDGTTEGEPDATDPDATDPDAPSDPEAPVETVPEVPAVPEVPEVPAGQTGVFSGMATLAELPRASVSTTYPSGLRQVRVPAGASLQAAIDAAQPGDALLLAPGATYTGNFVMTNKAGAGWIVIRTDVSDAALGSPGTRMTPSRASSLGLAKIVTPNSMPALSTALGAHHWRVTGVEVTAATTVEVYDLVSLGGGYKAQNSLSLVAHDLVIDRSYLHGKSSFSLRRCLAVNSASTAVLDSWLGECHSDGGDSQAIAGWNGPGPFLIQNNTLESGHQAFMFGGGDPAISQLVPSDITIRGNHMTRPPSWKGVWQTKTIVETKNARRVLIEGNLIENVWADGQVGFAILFKSVNQDGTCGWCTTSDVTVRYNRIRNVGGVFNIAARPEYHPAIPAARFTIHDNITDAVDTGIFQGPGIGLQVIGDVADLVFAHNTTIDPDGHSSTMFDGPGNSRLVMHSNVLSSGQYGVFGSGKGTGTAALSYYAPNGLFANNAIIGGGCGSYPAGTICPATMSELGFANALLGDYRITSTSLPSGYDGRPLGADVGRVNSAIMGAVVAQ